MNDADFMDVDAQLALQMQMEVDEALDLQAFGF
jgi:hypothetical protein